METIFLDLFAKFKDLIGAVVPDNEVLTAVIIGFTLAGAVISFAAVMMSLMTWVERKLIGRFQNRYGPNRVGLDVLGALSITRPIWNILSKVPFVKKGLFGLGQPIADGIKMVTKEDIIPDEADKVLHWLAPIVILFPALFVFALLPHGKGMWPTNISVGFLAAAAAAFFSAAAAFFFLSATTSVIAWVASSGLMLRW